MCKDTVYHFSSRQKPTTIRLTMTWDILDKDQLRAFIDSVKTTEEGILFNPVSSEGRVTPLPFYSGFKLYRLTNFASIPIFRLHFLSDGTRFFYLDGSINPLMTVGDLGGLTLTRNNVIAFLNFYFFAVVQEEGEIFLVQDPSTYPYQDDQSFNDTASTGFNFGPQAAAAAQDITQDEDGGFLVDTPLFMDGTLVRARLHVGPQGRVDILSQRIMLQGGASGDSTHPLRNE